MAIRLSGHLLETFFETCQAQEGEQRQSTTNLVQQKIPGVGRRRRGGRPLHPCVKMTGASGTTGTAEVPETGPTPAEAIGPGCPLN